MTGPITTAYQLSWRAPKPIGGAASGTSAGTTVTNTRGARSAAVLGGGSVARRFCGPPGGRKDVVAMVSTLGTRAWRVKALDHELFVYWAWGYPFNRRKAGQRPSAVCSRAAAPGSVGARGSEAAAGGVFSGRLLAMRSW